MNILSLPIELLGHILLYVNGDIDVFQNIHDKLDWKKLSHNKYAIYLLEKNPDKIDWNIISSNEYIYNYTLLLQKNKKKINWKRLSMNDKCIPYIIENKNKINMKYLCYNINYYSVIKTNLDYYIKTKDFDKYLFSKYLDDEKLVKKYIDYIDFSMLCKNNNLNIILYLSENLDKYYTKIDWKSLSSNRLGIEHIISKYMDTIDEDLLDWNLLCIHNDLSRNILLKNLELSKTNPKFSKIKWDLLSYYCYSINKDILEKNLDKLNWIYISKNVDIVCNTNIVKNVIQEHKLFLLDNKNIDNPHYHKLSWFNISSNIENLFLIEQYIDMIDINLLDWNTLSISSKSYNLLLKNFNKINWSNLCMFGDKKLFKLFDYGDNIDWNIISQNENANELLIKNIDNIYWKTLSLNKKCSDVILSQVKNNFDLPKIKWKYLLFTDFFMVYPKYVLYKIFNI